MKGNNFFKAYTSRYNTPDFMVYLSPENIQGEAKRIFREMIKGKIDFAQYGSYFQDPKFTENLLVACEAEFNFNSTNAKALYYYALHTRDGSEQVRYNYETSTILAHCYKTILDRLRTLKASFYSDIGCLTDIPIILSQYRNYNKL